ncbi:MAG TPA: phosphatidylserine decarboxylase family protein [Gemmatimonadales bacterium]|nr:phosphatidylserine decarboxylase family protein [Gemmatimonadales bacterium]
MRVAPEGWPFIIGAWLIAALALWLWPPGLIFWLPIAIWVVAFFRDPVRDGPRGDNVVIAPADGKVVSVLEVDEPSFVGGKATRISIFMNVFNVHVNRYPSSGTVSYRHYNPGRFGHAAGEKASLDNEQCSIGLTTARGKILVRQIAGLVARRIVTDDQVGATARQGERMGLIRFGSRVDVFVPPGATARVAVDQITQAGVTVVASWD